MQNVFKTPTHSVPLSGSLYTTLIFVVGGSSLNCAAKACWSSLHQESLAACVQKVTKYVLAGAGQPNKKPVSDSGQGANQSSETLTLSCNQTLLIEGEIKSICNAPLV